MQFLAYLAVMIIATAIAQALAPRPVDAKPASLQDFDVPTAGEGRAIPVIFGTVEIDDPSVVWYGDLKTRPIKASGGK